MGAWLEGEDTTATIAGKSMTVAGIDDAKGRACKNGATPNPKHSSGRPDRLGALCVRTCVDHLDEAGLVSNTFDSPFRKRPAWQIDSLGNKSLQE